ncbi:unnamed protein product [Leptidea sinapis]|uniref:B9 domain-containing protein 2 n=1 Tax=Leptidea sinapis TaxID=189913 RepID=A0A5E4QEJ9_9NEOP|nr:unnamed protein product [Leptidea sinapis]
MAELHILGQLKYSIFGNKNSLFCRYSTQTGPNWTLISGSSEGQTLSGKPDHEGRVIWSHPIDLHFITKGIQGWPKLLLQVSCLDSLGRSWLVGYGCCNLPAGPGSHTIRVPCWIPAATSITDKLRQHFLGGSHQLARTDVIALGTDRVNLTTESTGLVELEVCIVLRNFTQFGIEYK